MKPVFTQVTLDMRFFFRSRQPCQKSFRRRRSLPK